MPTYFKKFLRFNSHKFILISIILSAVLVTSQKSYSFEILLNDIAPGGSDPLALAGFEAAADLWEERFFDPITLRIDVGFQSLGNNIIGQTVPQQEITSYTDIRSALISDAIGLSDSVATANLPLGDSLRFRTNDPSGAVILDEDGSINNQNLSVNRANLKALSLLVDDGISVDAEILFSSDFSFDFDPSNGIDTNAFDFVGVAAHEIGHALGFVSGVDIVDQFTGAGALAPFDLNPFGIFSVFDLYRYSEDSLVLGGLGTLDFATGGTPLFALDPNLLLPSLTAPFATGVANGDGDQASHWKDIFPTLLHKPSGTRGTLLSFGPLDTVALDVIGYDRFGSVPVPSTILLLPVGLGLLLLFRKRHIAGKY